MQLRIASIVLALVAQGLAPAQAEVSEALCAQVRSGAKSGSAPWVALDRRDKPTALKSGGTVDKKSADKIVHLAMRDDGDSKPTVIGIKIKFVTQGNQADLDVVRAKNNRKDDAVPVKYKDFQDFHREGQESFPLRANFHLTRALVFGRQIPFTTYEPSERRQQLVLPKPAAGEEASYRVYLFLLDGVRPDGSCVDFKPFFPNGTKQAEIEVVNLTPNKESGQFENATIRFGLAE